MDIDDPRVRAALAIVGALILAGIGFYMANHPAPITPESGFVGMTAIGFIGAALWLVKRR